MRKRSGKAGNWTRFLKARFRSSGLRMILNPKSLVILAEEAAEVEPWWAETGEVGKWWRRRADGTE
jgi:hypothetical protein